MIEIKECQIEAANTKRSVHVVLTCTEMCAIDIFTGVPQEEGLLLHFGVELKDNGTPALTRYK